LRSETAAANATAVDVRTGAVLIKNIKVAQRTVDAPRLFLQIFNVHNPSVGSTAPEIVIPVPAGNATLDSASLSVEAMTPVGGLYLSTGFAYAVTTTPSGSTNPDGGDEPRILIDYNQLGA